MSNDTVPGGWSEFKTEITAEEMEMFKEVMKGLIGVDYTPLAVATQVVAGTNYEFFCNGHVVRPDAVNRAYIIKMYKPLKGDVQLDEIREIRH